MLAGPWVPDDPHRIDFAALPRVPSQHVLVSDVRAENRHGGDLDRDRGGVNQHNYLAHHDGKFWIMWSDGPGIEDRVGQRVKFATSRDGLRWSTPQFLTPAPPGSGPTSPLYGQRSERGLRYISRGFWQRGGELVALASLDEAGGFFGPSLALHAFRLAASGRAWEAAGIVCRDAINNFPPERLPDGQWMMSRRPHNYRDVGVHFLIGGVDSIDQWASVPVLGSNTELSAEEPHWWGAAGRTPGDALSRRAVAAASCIARYPRTADAPGACRREPISPTQPPNSAACGSPTVATCWSPNPNPRKRDPLTISIGDDGLLFHTMAFLVGGRWVDYPHVIEHGDHLFIAFAGGKQTVEMLRVRTSDLDGLRNPPAGPARRQRVKLL